MVVLALIAACGHGAHDPAREPRPPRPALPPLVCTGLCGRVLWPDGEPAYEVAIVITHPDGSEDVKVTGSDGGFDFPDAPIGTYALAVLQASRRFPDVAVERAATGPQQLPDIVVAEPVVCTLVGCDDGITIQLVPRAAWPAGAYQFRLELDGEVVTCAGSVPIGACGDADVAPCAANHHRVHVSSACDRGERFDTIRIGTPATAIAVEISEAGRVVGAATYRPTYTVIHPNGPEPECGSCTNAADVTLRLAW